MAATDVLAEGFAKLPHMEFMFNQLPEQDRLGATETAKLYPSFNEYWEGSLLFPMYRFVKENKPTQIAEFDVAEAFDKYGDLPDAIPCLILFLDPVKYLSLYSVVAVEFANRQDLDPILEMFVCEMIKKADIRPYAYSSSAVTPQKCLAHACVEVATHLPYEGTHMITKKPSHGQILTTLRLRGLTLQQVTSRSHTDGKVCLPPHETVSPTLVEVFSTPVTAAPAPGSLTKSAKKR
jgi:hypothetical protein